MPYKIISANGYPQHLIAAVEREEADGWQPQGGVCATMHQGSGVISFYQAMVKPAAQVESPPNFAVQATEPDAAQAAAPAVIAAPSTRKPRRKAAQ